jgi:hypothetical protein
MKRLIPTLLLVILCIGGYWYASSKNFFREKPAEPKTLVTGVKSENVQSVTLTNDGQETELKLGDGNKWTMTKPSALPIDGDLVTGWADSFNTLTYEAKVEDAASDLSKYGLDKPKQSYTLAFKDGSSRTVDVGNPLAIQGYSYVNVDGGKTVYQVSDQTIQSLAKQPVDFQLKGPVKFDYDKVTSMQVTWKDASWTLQKVDKDKPAADAAWKLGAKDLKGADASPIMDALLFLSTQIEAKPAAAANGTDFKAVVTETDNGKDTTTTYTGKVDGDNVWIAKQGDSWAYAIPSKSIQDLADKGKQ